MERYTERVRRVLEIAKERAACLGHERVGTEHLLMGVIDIGEGVGMLALIELGVDTSRLRTDLELAAGVGAGGMHVGAVNFDPGAQEALAFAAEEATSLHHTYIGTEHVLLGLLRVDGGVAARVLQSAGLGREAVRATILDVLAGK